MGLKIAPLRVKDMHGNAETNDNMNPFEFTNVAFQLLHCTVNRLSNDAGLTKWFGVNVFKTNTVISLTTASSETGNTLDKNLKKISYKDCGFQIFRFSLDGIQLPNKEWKSLSIVIVVFLFQRTVLTVMCWKEHISLMGNNRRIYS